MDFKQVHFTLISNIFIIINKIQLKISDALSLLELYNFSININIKAYS